MAEDKKKEDDKKKADDKKKDDKKPDDKKKDDKKPDDKKKEDDKKKDEKKVVEIKTAVYKVFVHCPQCGRDIQTQFTEFPGVEEVKLDAKAGKVTVKGVGFDAEKLRAKVQRRCRKKVELVPPAKKEGVVFEVKKKEEKLKIITVKVALHCPECEVRVKEILLENKSIYAAKTDLKKNTCTVEGVLEEKKLIEYIYKRTRKRGVVDKVEEKVIVKEEKVEKKEEKKDDKKKDDKKDDKKKDDKKDDKKKTEVIAPYFIPCTHPRFLDYSHPCHRGGYCSPCGGGGYGYGGGCGCGYPYGVSYTYTHPELKGYNDTSFLHCTHPGNEFISDENPYACSVM